MTGKATALRERRIVEEPLCRGCGSGEAIFLHEGKDRLCGVEGTFRIARCRGCGLIFLAPGPSRDQIAKYYPEESYQGYAKAIEDEPGLFLRLNRRYGLWKKCRVVLGAKKSGRLLDVGCATGIFMEGMRRHGWEVIGVDTSAAAARYARERFGLEVRVGELGDAGFPDESVDVVTLWNVVEHLADPATDLREIHRILRHDGLLLIATPNAGSLDARLFGQFWALLDVPRHYYVFSPDNLRRLLERVGFQVSGIRCFFGAWHSFATSLQFLLEDKLGRPLLGGGSLGDRLEVQGLRWTMQPYFLLIDQMKKGPMMTVLCRKA